MTRGPESAVLVGDWSCGPAGATEVGRDGTFMTGGAVGEKFGIDGVGLGGVAAGAAPPGPSPGRAEPEAVRRPVTVEGREGGAGRFKAAAAAGGTGATGGGTASIAAGATGAPTGAVGAVWSVGAAAGGADAGVAFVAGAGAFAGAASAGSDFFTTLRAAVRPSVAFAAGFAAEVASGVALRGVAAWESSTGTASVPVSTATAAPPPVNQSRIVAARPAEIGDRCVETSGISSDWHFAMMSFEVTPSSFASWWTLRLAFFVVDKIWSPGCVRPYTFRVRS
jgi:hypothetical protein